MHTCSPLQGPGRYSLGTAKHPAESARAANALGAKPPRHVLAWLARLGDGRNVWRSPEMSYATIRS